MQSALVKNSLLSITTLRYSEVGLLYEHNLH